MRHSGMSFRFFVSGEGAKVVYEQRVSRNDVKYIYETDVPCSSRGGRAVGYCR